MTEETTTEIEAYHPQRTVDLRNKTTDSWTDVARETFILAAELSHTEFVPKGLRGSKEKTAAALFYGREIGLPPMTGLSAISMIEGKPSISAEMQRALILQAGHELVVVESTRERCEIKGRRKGSDEWTSAVWTIGEANQTKVFLSAAKGWGPLSAKSQWQSWPTEMLLARATTRLARMIFPDVIHGMRSVEELTDMLEEEDVVGGTVPAAPPAVEPVQRKRVTPKPRGTNPASQEGVEPATEEPPAEVAKPVQRKRKERTPAKTTTPAPTPEPEPVPEPEREVVDAEVIEPDPEPEPPADDDVHEAEVIDEWIASQPKVTEQQLKKLLVQFDGLEIKGREERIWMTSQLINREVKTAKELTRTEASSLIDRLDRCKTRGDVELLIAAESSGG